jgi:CheY-like chemotaxis protein
MRPPIAVHPRDYSDGVAKRMSAVPPITHLPSIAQSQFNAKHLDIDDAVNEKPIMPLPKCYKPQSPPPSSFRRLRDIRDRFKNAVRAPAAMTERAMTAFQIAILDDEPSIRTALGRLLKSMGMTVDTFAESQSFFASLALKTPDCLILDLQMPGLSGLEVLKYLRQHAIHIPTIIITAHDAKGSREACLNAGAAAYLCKPLDIEHLIQTIREVGAIRKYIA